MKSDRIQDFDGIGEERPQASDDQEPRDWTPGPARLRIQAHDQHL